MKTLRRNKRPFYYRKYLGRYPIKKDNYETGEYEHRYSQLKTGFEHISAGRGERYIRDFGVSLEYDRKIFTTSLDLVEGDILWIGVLPIRRVGNRIRFTPNNYIVVGVADSLNSKVLAIRRVNVGG